MLAAVAVVVAALGMTNAAFAADGVFEINDFCASSTGCFAGEAAGYPVTITQPGAYQLTGSGSRNFKPRFPHHLYSAF